MGGSASVETFSSISDSSLRDKITHAQKLYYKEDKKDAALSECYSICATYYKDEALKNEKYQFLEFLVSVIIAPNVKNTRANALNGIMWMSLHPPNSTRLCSVKLQLVSSLINLMNNSVPDRLNAVKVLGNMCGNISPGSNVNILFKDYKLHEAVLNLIKESGCCQLEREEYIYVSRCLFILMRCLVRDVDDCNEIVRKTNGALETLQKVLDEPSNGAIIRTTALIVIIFLIGKQEKSSISINTRPDLIAFLHKKLEDILENKGDSGIPNDNNSAYSFSPNTIVKAILFLCISDANRMVIANSDFLPILIRMLKRYVDNEPSLGSKNINIGGGGNDDNTAGLAIETMLQLSFVYEDEYELQTKLMPPNLGIKELVQLALLRERFSSDQITHCKLISGRLTPVIKKTVVHTEAPVVVTEDLKSNFVMSPGSGHHRKKSHVMISYCWNKDAKPELVKEVSSHLKGMGYDVWRDEEGSSIVPPMAGNTDERMAEALEASSHIVIIVSKPYKESPNCRIEAKYANQLWKKGKVNLIFVMAQKEYTTVSERDHGDSCDGWLGIMLGDALWYPLWEKDQVAKTAKELSVIIGENAKLSTNQQHQEPPEISKESPSRPVVVKESNITVAVDHLSAYNLLLNHDYHVEGKDILKIINDFGISLSDDLLLLESEHIQELAQFLKVIPRKKFLHALNLN